MLAYARRKTEKLFAEAGKTVDNLILLTLNIVHIYEAFDENELDRIYINFCPPWRRERDFKHCLTHPKMLVSYAKILKPGAEIRFKTDDDRLFDDSIGWLRDTGFTVKLIERDLHNSDLKDNIITEHEKMFAEEGKKIKFLIAENVK
jgi:tRNA (guanine-N7-)-methyltransferase